ncbi:unnamed protein product [Cunninghamella blakesleeana]
MSTWLYSSRIYSFMLLFIISFIFWSSDLFLFGCIFIAYFIKEEKSTITTNTTTTTFNWNIDTIEEEVGKDQLTLKHLQKKLEENTRELQLLSEYWPEVTNMQLLSSPLSLDNSNNKKQLLKEEEKLKEREEEIKKAKEKEGILKKEIVEAHQTIDKLKYDLSNTKIELRTHFKEKEKKYGEEMEYLKQQKITLSLELKIIEEKLEDYKNRYNEHMESNTKLKQNIIDLQSQNEELLSHLEEEEQKVKKMDLFVRENDQELQRVTDHAIQCENQIDELKLQLQQHQERLSTLENIENGMVELEQSLDEKNKEIIELKQLEAELRQEVEQVTNHQQEITRHQNEKAEEELKLLLQQIEQEKASFSQLLESKAKVALEINDLSDQLFQLNETKQQRLNEIQQLNENIATIENSSSSDYVENKLLFRQPSSKRLVNGGNGGRQERSSSIPRLSLSRSTSLKTNNSRKQYHDDTMERELYEKTQQYNEAVKNIARLETMVGELQRQLEDCKAHLEDRDDRLRQIFSK